MAEYNHEINDDDPASSSGAKRIDCLRCRYYEVTWDPAFPRGCRVFGIKGREMPSVTVRASTGRDCPSFEPKSPR